MQTQIPTYPTFKEVRLTDKEAIDVIVKKFPPYCDFNFSNIYNWSDPDFPTTVSLFKRCLIFCMRDFTSKEEIVSFIGKDYLGNLTKKLVAKHKKLSLVPDCVFLQESPPTENFIITGDRDSYDYIMSLANFSDLKGGKYKTIRKIIHRVRKVYPKLKVSLLDLENSNHKKQITDLFIKWAMLKGITKKDFEREQTAICRFMDTAKLYNLANVGIYVDNGLAGFTLNEINGKYAMGGYGKTDLTLEGISDILEHETAKVLLKYGCRFLNYEQDLGILGLREHKLSLKPAKFLKKYVIANK
jgi:hypothetical protein